ncbi:MAG TPA: DUF4202 domain-containing protein [Thermohalobaculum sp.]|nr:DUF4202 domain-containing protein [Thermohalobaculum sp.]
MTGKMFSDILQRIDAANAADPEIVEEDGMPHPAALLYGRRMSAELVGFCPDASEHLRVAARGQHIERWKLQRRTYPEGREGYLAWRRDQGRFHASRVAELMGQAGYGPDDCDRVAKIIRKEGIKRDSEVQALEDVACLVFMRWYAVGFAGGRDPEHVYRIVAKTARKMSAEGRAFATRLNLPAELAPALVV